MPIDPTSFLFSTARVFIPVIISDADLKTALEQHSPKVAGGLTGVGALGAALAAPSMYAASQGTLWGLAASVGLVSAPAWVPVAGGVAGLLAAGSGAKYWIDSINYKKRKNAVRVGYHLCSLVAAASQAALQDDVATLLNQYRLEADDKDEIKRTVPKVIGEVEVHDLEDDFRRQILKAVGQFCFRAGGADDLKVLFNRTAERLDLVKDRELIFERCREAHERQSNLVEGMFVSCDYLLKRVDLGNAAPFLDAVRGYHPQRERLERTVRVGGAIAAGASAVAWVAGYPEAAQIISQAWNGIRGAAGRMADRQVERGYDELVTFAADLGIKAADVERTRTLIDKEYALAEKNTEQN
jgi:hypothetical protein